MYNIHPTDLDNILEELLSLEDFGYWDNDNIPPVIGCQHEWRKDSFFSTIVYETCKKCGAKKEEL